MEGTIVPVQLNKVWNKKHTWSDYDGGTSRRYVKSARILFLTRGEERDFSLTQSNFDEFSPWLKKYYEEHEEDAVGSRLVALLDEDDNVVTFGESKEALESLEEHKLE